MKHYKTKDNQLFFEPSKEVIAKHSLIAIDEKEFKAILEEAQKPSEEQLKLARIEELKSLLANSDYKVFPDYDKPNEEIIKQRQAWREEIRELSK